MGDEYSEYVYSKKDIDKAFYMGLETAIVVLEESMALSRTDRRYMLDFLKKRIIWNKIKAIMEN